MGISYSPDPMLAVNMFVWQDADALFEFVYRSAHTPVMAGRRDYFQKFAGAYQALWWLPAGEFDSGRRPVAIVAARAGWAVPSGLHVQSAVSVAG